MPAESPPDVERASPPDLEQEELRAISRTVAEMHWLLLILVLLYVIFAGPDKEAEAAIAAALVFYAAFVMVFRFANLNFFNRWSRWKVALESWAMIAFITWVLGFTGALTSPLVNAYLLPVITAALTLGTLTTLAEVGLIAACYLYLGGGVSTDRLLSLAFYGEFAAQLAPLLLVAYIVSLFSANIRYGLDRAKLLAETDGLTGLLNLRGFAIAADPLFAQALRYNRESAILMIDSDNLKYEDYYDRETNFTSFRVKV